MKELREQFSAVASLLHLNNKMNTLMDPQQLMVKELEYALAHSRVIAIQGREGSGKSSAIAWFKQLRPNVYYIRVGPSYTIKSLLNEILFQLTGVFPARGDDSLFIKVKEISRELTRNEEKKMLIVDECGKLSPRSISVLHEIKDHTETYASMVFVGLPYFQANMKKEMERGVKGVAEFYRRIQKWVTVPPFSVEREGPSYLKSRGLTPEQIRLILREAAYQVETIAQLESIADLVIEAGPNVDESFVQSNTVQLTAPNFSKKGNSNTRPKRASKPLKTVDEIYEAVAE